MSQRAIEDRNNTYVDLTVDEEADIEIEIFGSTTVRVGSIVQVHNNSTRGDPEIYFMTAEVFFVTHCTIYCGL